METEKRYPYATVELTERCNIRCKHCYYFKDERGRLKDLPDQEILTRLAELQRRYGIKAMSWAGGEPLLRQRCGLRPVWSPYPFQPRSRTLA